MTLIDYYHLHTKRLDDVIDRLRWRTYQLAKDKNFRTNAELWWFVSSEIVLFLYLTHFNRERTETVNIKCT